MIAETFFVWTFDGVMGAIGVGVCLVLVAGVIAVEKIKEWFSD